MFFLHNCLHRASAAAAAALLAWGAAALEPVPGGADAARRAEAARWADSVYSSLSVRERFGQLMMPKAVPTGGETSKATLRRLARAGMTGILFTEGSLAQYVEMTNYAQSQAKVPLLMTFDGEWGLNMRIRELPQFPSNMALGAVQNPRLIYRYGQEMGRQCRLIGIQCNFAPDADVNSNPANPVIGYRAFGEDPARVAEASVAYSLGLEDAGVQATPKHFPGHGDTQTDSHKTVTTVGHSRALMDSVDLEPFRQSIRAGVSGIMVGHLVVPSLDPSGQPASLSPAMTTDLLRGELGFEGLVYTDALGMKGARDINGRNAAHAAFLAGADILLSPPSAMDMLDTFVAEYQAGRISEQMLEQRCKRVLRYKYYLGLSTKPHVSTDIDALRRQIASPECMALIDELAAGCITVLRNDGGILPVANLAQASIAVVTIGNSDNARVFEQTCGFYAGIRAFHSNGGAFSAASIEAMRNADVTIVAVFDDKAATRETFAQVAACGAPGMVAAFMVNPYKMKKFAAGFQGLKGMVLAYDNIEATARAAAEAVFGGIEVSGRLPVNLRGVAPLGAGLRLPKTRLGFTTPLQEGLRPWLTDSLDAYARMCVRAGAMPGCQIIVGKGGNIVYDRCFGRIAGPGSAKVDDATVYDLASVSKATGTLSGIMKAYDMGLLDLDRTLGELIPEITDTAKQPITVRQLLYHETGMPAALNMYDVMMDTNTYTGRLIARRRDAQHPIKVMRNAWGHKDARLRSDIVKRQPAPGFDIEGSRGQYLGRASYDTIMRRIYNIPLRQSRDYNYSCLNFCLLMDIEQRLTGRPHDEFVAAEVWAPLGANRAGYRPAARLPLSEIAATENDTYLRRQTVHGYVHDETANYSGGVQGNAGFFGSARDIAKYCQMLLNGGTYGDAAIISPETASLFMTSKSPTCRRGLGFDKPDPDPDRSPTCEEADLSVVGHLGFTGTVFWIDPAHDMFFVFLTNRVYPTRDTPVFNSLNVRPHLFSLVYKAMEDNAAL